MAPLANSPTPALPVRPNLRVKVVEKARGNPSDPALLRPMMSPAVKDLLILTMRSTSSTLPIQTMIRLNDDVTL
jgi:hypothetical protein